jgi:rhodanese-related sulfurtransferase
MNLLDLLFSFFKAGPDGGRRLTPTDAAQLVRENKAVLVDVREPAEWAETGVAQKAALLSFSDLTGPRRQWAPFLAQLGGRELILYCHSGARSGAATRLLVREGYRATNLGTLRGWHRAGLPVCKPRGMR